MTIDFSTLKDEMLATPEGVARAIKISDQHGNAYGQVTWVWEDGVLSASAAKLPNGYEGQMLGVDDLPKVQAEGVSGAQLDQQAQDVAMQLMLWGIGVVSSPNEGGAAKPAIGPLTLAVKTERGTAQAHVSCDGGFIQIHVMYACQQPPFFVVLAESMADKVISTITKLIEGADLPSSANITDQVEGAVEAGTSARIEKLEVKFAIPHVGLGNQAH